MKMTSKEHLNTASYLSPTESSARKNIQVEPFYEETSLSTFNTYLESTPPKQGDKILTSEKLK